MPHAHYSVYYINALCCTSGKAGVPSVRHGNYKKWLRYYLDFCGMYRLAVGYSKSPLDLQYLTIM